MKTSNKLLLGLFLLILVIITAGLIYLKGELNKISLSNSDDGVIKITTANQIGYCVKAGQTLSLL
jgi:hypothetical protein